MYYYTMLGKSLILANLIKYGLIGFFQGIFGTKQSLRFSKLGQNMILCLKFCYLFVVELLLLELCQVAKVFDGVAGGDVEVELRQGREGLSVPAYSTQTEHVLAFPNLIKYFCL